MSARRESQRLTAAIGTGLCLAATLSATARPAEARTPCAQEARRLRLSTPPRAKVKLECEARGRLSAAYGVARARIPAKGLSVTAYVTTTGGTAQLTLSHRADGRVIASDATAPSEPSRRRATDDACTDATYVSRGSWPKGSTVHLQQYAPNSTALDWSLPEGIRRASHAVTDCDKRGVFSPPPNIRASIDSRTPKPPGIDAGGTCGDSDGVNTVGFLNFADPASRLLAITCVWRRGTHIVEADIAMRADGVAWWMSETPPGTPKTPCPPSHYDAVSVATHESLHLLGLAHVPSGHDSLSLAPVLPACNTDPSTLGLGDYRGLIHLYGPAPTP
ncbi:hypothetical protein [Actinomadura gamaensis]|uniref:Matrixin family metalloprotease n=1 Tax=Actinomadura gamaensis TaxID=1763541 RepID=A0ABV9U687_9ACTN